MKDILILESIEQVKAISDSLRLKIIKAIKREPLTAKQIAAKIGEKPSRLYYHVDALEGLGLIELIETRPVRGTVEKYYRAAAEKYVAGLGVLSGHEHSSELLSIVTNLLENTLAEVTRAEQLIHESARQHLPSVFSKVEVSATPDSIRAMTGKLQALLNECQTMDQADAPITYSLTIAFYPIEVKEESNDEHE